MLYKFCKIIFFVGLFLLVACQGGNPVLKTGFSSLDTGDYNAAISSFKEVLAEDEKNQQALVGMIESLIALEQYDEALTCLDYINSIDNFNKYVEIILAEYHSIDEQVVEEFIEKFIHSIKKFDAPEMSYILENGFYDLQPYFALIASHALSEELGYPEFGCSFTVEELNTSLNSIIGYPFSFSENSVIEHPYRYTTWDTNTKLLSYNIWVPHMGGAELVEYEIDKKQAIVKASVIHYNYGVFGEDYDFGLEPMQLPVFIGQEWVGIENHTFNGETSVSTGIDYLSDKAKLVTHIYTFEYDENNHLKLISCDSL